MLMVVSFGLFLIGWLQWTPALLRMINFLLNLGLVQAGLSP